jgi:N-acetylneuraminate synthase
VWTTGAESESLRLRPSLYVTSDVSAGDLITAENVRSVRPAGGLPPVELPNVLGRRFTTDATVGTPVSWDVVR